MILGTPLSPAAVKVMLLGSGELGKEVVIELQRLGVETIAVDRYANAPAAQVAHRAHVIDMTDAKALRALVERERPHFLVPEIEALATDELVRHGGQNPIEAAKLGSAILHGPHVWNFAEIYTALDEAHGAEPVLDANRLTACFGAWLGNPEAGAHVATIAKSTVDALGGGLERTLHSLDPYLMQLQLRQRAYNA